jgi:hypothetical protein
MDIVIIPCRKQMQVILCIKKTVCNADGFVGHPQGARIGSEANNGCCDRLILSQGATQQSRLRCRRFF